MSEAMNTSFDGKAEIARAALSTEIQADMYNQ